MGKKKSKNRKDKPGEIIHIRYPYVVKASRTGFIVYNSKMNDFDNWHTHIRGKKTSIKLVDNIFTNTVPNSNYLRESILRICNDKKFLDTVRRKIEKDKQKPSYINVNKGGVGR